MAEILKGNDFAADLPEQLLKGALTQGAQAVEVYQSSSFDRPAIFEGNRLKQVETTQAEGVSLRLWKDGKPGVAVGYGPVEPAVLIEKALAVSQLNQPETPRLASGEQKDFGQIGQSVPIEQLIDQGWAAIAHIKEHFPEAVCEAELSCNVETTRLLNSEGLDYRHQDTTLGGYLNAELIGQDDFLSVGDGVIGRDRIDVMATASSIIERMDWAQRTVAPISGQVPIIFTARAAGLLWSTLRSALNGKNVKEGTSPWGDKWGDHVISPAITLRQDPHVGPYSCPFDDEGVLTQSIDFVEKGVVKSWYTDLTTGSTARLSAEMPGISGSSGNGIRPGLGGYPTPGLINLLVTAGKLPWEALIAQQTEAIIVDQMMGEGGDITGNLSVNLELGYRVRAGEIVGRVKDTMVSGNAYSALKNLIALGSDRQWNGSTYTPAVVVEGLFVTG
ncbi:TldD/PmbA family protein [cf. Phormidesmis sp. LEGE 11477]|uniref:TldD/PmbA family protein n=1 Tax=cf. Phormidesmis sp. LEGE 11477 TaxID=1828680 RepID=UPI00188026E8|nr:TldD/PmbA family protein [cf. Phormidesmis sp. LEGE 11477]MBE9060710.1 TldD/PmbA family protein [cf. Phormidesmis sp. LEGE 11477]